MPLPFRRSLCVPLVLCLLAGLPSGPLVAATATTWELSSYADISRGRMQGVSLQQDGRLQLAPRLDMVFASDQPAVWTAVRAADGTLYLGTGHRGRVYRVAPNGQATLLWTADEPEVFALALDRSGVLYAGTSPNGKVYRIENGKATEYYNPQTTYIWSLATGADALYVGTGDGGVVHRVTGPGQGAAYYETGQSHVTALAVDAQGRLLAGTEPNGILYRVTAKDQAFVLHDANLPEIRSITPQPDGSVYVAALGGSVGQRAAAASSAATTQAPVTAPSVSITVTDQASAQIGPEIKPQNEVTRQVPATSVGSITEPTSPLVDTSGVEKSAIYRILPDNTVETLWRSQAENAYDVALVGQELYFATDLQGRIYRLRVAPAQAARQVTLVAQTDEGETTRLISSGTDLMATTGSMGKLFRLSDAQAATGSYESPVHDASNIARWGNLRWQSNAARAGQLVLRTRTGNSARPDRTWSAWSTPLDATQRTVKIASPNARYLQWRAEWTGASTAGLQRVVAAYLPQNNAPTVQSINVTSQFAAVPANSSRAATPQTSATGTFSVTVTDTGEVSNSTPAGSTSQAVQRAGQSQIVLTWQAEDTDGDRMLYAVHMRGEEEQEWRLLRADNPDLALVFDAEVLADGVYYFRVTASDKANNDPQSTREAELVSAPYIVDHTPPRWVVQSSTRTGATAEIRLQADDATSPLQRIEYSLDAGLWQPVSPVDGVVDGLQESVVISLSTLSPGEHVLSVRVLDAVGNAGVVKTVLR